MEILNKIKIDDVKDKSEKKIKKMKRNTQRWAIRRQELYDEGKQIMKRCSESGGITPEDRVRYLEIYMEIAKLNKVRR